MLTAETEDSDIGAAAANRVAQTFFAPQTVVVGAPITDSPAGRPDEEVLEMKYLGNNMSNMLYGE